VPFVERTFSPLSELTKRLQLMVTIRAESLGVMAYGAFYKEFPYNSRL
jgi:hypothetical protein